MKKLLKNAMVVQHDLRKETVTLLAVGATLYPEGSDGTRSVMLSNIIKGNTQLKKQHIVALVGLFPDTDADYWCGLVDFKELYRQFVGLYTLEQIDQNDDLKLLYQSLNEEKYIKTIYNKYL